MDVFRQGRADAARAEKPQNGRGAHVDFQTKDAVAEKQRQHLWEHPEPHPAKPFAAGGFQAFEWFAVNVFNGFRKKFSQGAASVDRDGDHGGQQAFTHQVEENQRNHDFREGAHQIKQPAGDLHNGGRLHYVARGKTRQDYRYDKAQEGAEQCHVQRQQQVGNELGNPAEPFGQTDVPSEHKHVAREVKDFGDALAEGRRVGRIGHVDAD